MFFRDISIFYILHVVVYENVLFRSICDFCIVINNLTFTLILKSRMSYEKDKLLKHFQNSWLEDDLFKDLLGVVKGDSN